MKKSKHIQLVLITAALASCNRTIVPQEDASNIVADSTLTAPVETDSMYVDGYIDCNCQDIYPAANDSTRSYGTYYIGPTYGSYYYAGRRYRQVSGWQGSKVIVRGGFGKSSVHTGS